MKSGRWKGQSKNSHSYPMSNFNRNQRRELLRSSIFSSLKRKNCLIKLHQVYNHQWQLKPFSERIFFNKKRKGHCMMSQLPGTCVWLGSGTLSHTQNYLWPTLFFLADINAFPTSFSSCLVSIVESRRASIHFAASLALRSGHETILPNESEEELC